MCAVAALASLAWEHGRPEGALGVLAGAGMMAFSYSIIRGGVDTLSRRALARTGAAEGVEPPGVARVAWMLTKYVTRYGVLALAAWAVLVPLRASPVWLFVGVTVPVAAIAIEAVRLNRRR